MAILHHHHHLNIPTGQTSLPPSSTPSSTSSPPSIIDILAFSAVCTQWRSLPKAPTSSPPLLLCSSDPFRNPSSTPFPLRTLKTLTHDPRFFQSSMSELPLFRSLVGSSHGHLIFTSCEIETRTHTVFVADVFSTTQFCSPKLPPRNFYVSFGILTAPPSSSSCTLVVVLGRIPSSYGEGPEIRSWHLGAKNDNCWSVLKLDSYHSIRSALVYNEHVYCLLSNCYLLVFQPISPVFWKELKVRFSNRFTNYICSQYLGEWNGQLLLVLFVEAEGGMTASCKSQVYRLDFEKSLWVEVDSLGDWCLFLDGVSKSLLACANPSRWGGRSNSIYFDSILRVCPLYGQSFARDLLPNRLDKRTPSVWVYPILKASEVHNVENDDVSPTTGHEDNLQAGTESTSGEDSGEESLNCVAPAVVGEKKRKKRKTTNSENEKQKKGASSKVSKKNVVSVKEVMSILLTFPEFAPGTDLFYIAPRLMLKKSHREMFMALEKPSYQLAWLQSYSRENL